MGHGCEDSFYVSGIKLRSGQATAEWYEGSTRRRAVVFTDPDAAARHAARGGERADVVLLDDLLAMDSSVEIAISIPGVTTRLPFDKDRCTGRYARRFDPDALRKRLGEDDFEEVLNVCTANLPVEPGESRKYSQEVIDAWLEFQSPVGLAHTMRKLPGTLVAGVDDILDRCGNNIGVAAAVLDKRISIAAQLPKPPLGELADALHALADRNDGVYESNAFRNSLEGLTEMAFAHLADDPAAAAAALRRCGELVGAYGQPAGAALALVGAQALVEGALISQEASEITKAHRTLQTVCQTLSEDPASLYQEITARAAAAAADPTGSGTTRAPRTTALSGGGDANSRLWAAIDSLDEIPRACGAPPTTAVVSRSMRDEFSTEIMLMGERWCDEWHAYEERLSDTLNPPVASSWQVVPARPALPRSAAVDTEPQLHGGDAVISAAWYVALLDNGTVIAIPGKDRLSDDGMRTEATLSDSNKREYASVSEALRGWSTEEWARRPDELSYDVPDYDRAIIGGLVAQLIPIAGKA